MSTKITAIHDAIVSRIHSNLSSYLQLPNPYILEENPQSYLKLGFGVAVGDGERTDRVIGCQVSWKRTFIVTLVNYVTTTDSNTTIRENIAKSILEDHFTLLKQFEKAASLSNNAIDAIVVADSGIKFAIIQGSPYFIVEIQLEVEYLEDLT